MPRTVNRRRHSRISPLLIRAEFTLDARLCRGYVTNLSIEGAFLATREDVPSEHSLKVAVLLPWQMGRIEVRATVVWKREETLSEGGNQSAGYGIRFHDVDDGTRDLIEDYLARFRHLANQLPHQTS